MVRCKFQAGKFCCKKGHKLVSQLSNLLEQNTINTINHGIVLAGVAVKCRSLRHYARVNLNRTEIVFLVLRLF